MKRKPFLVGVCGLVMAFLVVAQAGSRAQAPGPMEAAAGGWTAVGPEGGNIAGMAFDPANPSQISAVVYGYPSAFYRTTDGAQSWQRVALINEYAHDIDYDPSNRNIVYVPGSARLWKTTDGGATWSSFSFPGSSYFTGTLEVHPTSPNILYGCGYSYSGSNFYITFFKSTNSGATWTAKTVSPAGTYAQAKALAISRGNPNLIFLSGYLYAGGTSYCLYRSTDGGSTWLNVTGEIGTGYPINALAVDPTNANKVYAGTSWGVYRSTNGGGSWAKNSGYAYSYALAIDRTNPGTIYSGYGKEVYKSADGGVNWTKSTGMFGTCAVMLASGASVYYGSNAGIFRSLNAGSTWEEVNSGMKASNIVAVTASLASPNIVYCEMSGTGFYRSANFGLTWTRLPDFYRCESITRILTGASNANEVFILAGG